MSMISAQCDELRKLARAFPDTSPRAALLRDAADTIWQLRDDLQRVNAENANLHNNADLLRAMLSQVQTEKRCYMAENAKLRETLKVLMVGTNAELCANRGESDCKECSMYHGEDECVVVDAMELLGIDMYGEPLGVEVDG